MGIIITSHTLSLKAEAELKPKLWVRSSIYILMGNIIMLYLSKLRPT
jgi:hypothetical protein